MGELAAFTIGWCLILSYVVGASSVAGSLSVYIDDLSGGLLKQYVNTVPLGAAGLREHLDLASVVLIVSLATLMCFGINQASKLTNICTSINICTLCLIMGLSLTTIDFNNWRFTTVDENGSPDNSPIQSFYTKYYVNSTGIKGEEYSKGTSFVDKYCMDGSLKQKWINLDTDEDVTLGYSFEMSCILDESNKTQNYNFLSTTRKLPNGKVTTDKQIKLDVGYGQNIYKIQENSTKENPDKIIQITETKPGIGGYLPYGISGLLAGTGTCFYGFVGFDAIATTGEEAINPQENIPKAITYSLIIICSVYLLISGLLTLSFPYFAINASSPFPAAFYWNGYGGFITVIRIGAVCALTSSLIGAVIPMPRILYNMSKDGLVFNWCAKVSKKNGSPVNATIVAGVVAAILAGIFKLEVLVDFMSIGTLAVYALVALCVLILRYRPDEIDEINKVGPSYEQGVYAEKLCYRISAWYLIGSLLIAKGPLIFGDTIYTTIIQLLVLATILIGSVFVIISLNKIPPSTKQLSFSVPGLPYLPLLNLLVNIYIMAELNTIVWAQLSVWLIVGYSIYIFYGIGHSKENESFSKNSSEIKDYKYTDALVVDCEELLDR